MCTCIYVYMCMYISIYARTWCQRSVQVWNRLLKGVYMYMWLHERVHISVCGHTYIYTHPWVFKYGAGCWSVCILLMNSCMCTRTCVCMYTHLTSAACSCTSFIYARIHKFEYIYTHTGVSVCARICGLNNRLQQSALLPTSYTYTYTHTISTHIYA